MLGIVKVDTGDFVKGENGQFVVDHFLLRVPGKFLRENITIADVEEVDIATEENVKKLEGTIGWGVASRPCWLTGRPDNGWP